MGKLLDLLGERRRRQAGNDVVRFFYRADFDQTAICAVKVGQNTMLEQKVTEPFDAFMKRAAAIARDREHPFVRLQNLPVDDEVSQASRQVAATGQRPMSLNGSGDMAV
jgi:hypothetical protein